MSVEAKERLAARLAPAIESAMENQNSEQTADFAGGVLVILNREGQLFARIGKTEIPDQDWGYNAYRLASILYEQMSQDNASKPNDGTMLM